MPPPAAPVAQAPIEVQLLAFNDFHGNLETPPAVEVAEADGSKRTDRDWRCRQPRRRAGAGAGRPSQYGDGVGGRHHRRLAAHFAHYLDEPTIAAMNALGLEFNSVGNHEFDKGGDELRRMQAGGLRQVHAPPAMRGRAVRRCPLPLSRRQRDWRRRQDLLPRHRLKTFGSGREAITIGFIGMTLKSTGNLVTPSGVQA
jgi:5'-nucleotidase